AESSGVQDAGASEVFWVSGTRVLRQIADLATAVETPARRQLVTCEHLGQSRLSRAVATDEADLVAVAHAERHVLHQEAGANANLEVVHGKHRNGPFRQRGCVAEGPTTQYTSPT